MSAGATDRGRCTIPNRSRCAPMRRSNDLPGTRDIAAAIKVKQTPIARFVVHSPFRSSAEFRNLARTILQRTEAGTSPPQCAALCGLLVVAAARTRRRRTGNSAATSSRCPCGIASALGCWSTLLHGSASGSAGGIASALGCWSSLLYGGGLIFLFHGLLLLALSVLVCGVGYGRDRREQRGYQDGNWS